MLESSLVGVLIGMQQATARRTGSGGVDELSVVERIKRCYRESRYPQLGHLEVDGATSHVVIRGRVESWYLKQVAQELANSVCEEAQAGIEVRSEVCVIRPGPK